MQEVGAPYPCVVQGPTVQIFSLQHENKVQEGEITGLSQLVQL